jgi:ATP-dependent Lon protease
MFFRERRGNGASGGGRKLPLLPLRELVVFPHSAVSFIVGRERSVAALNEAVRGDKEIFLAAQREALTSDPGPDDVHAVGTIASVVQIMRLPDAKLKVLVDGRRRGRISRFHVEDDCFRVEVEEIPEESVTGPEVDALVRGVRAGFEEYARLNKGIPPETLLSVGAVDEPGRLADTLARHLNLKTDLCQEVLEDENPITRLERVQKHLQSEIEILQVERKIKSRVQKQMERSQKEHYLNEQMQAIQKELGEKDEFKLELQELEARIAERKLSAEAQDRVSRELRKLKMMNPMSAEAAVVRNYIDWIVSMPWGEFTEDRIDVVEARRVLDQDHFGLGKVKQRILEYLAVVSLVQKLNGPILCLVGPPGVGKTSLARSIARATNRKFVRVALGGVRDEAEIRGHRRTYIGAMPGKIAHGLKKAGSSNPVFLLDEIDKMSSDFRGDPSAALLEVLDPEQNNSFNDHYLDLDYDLSRVMFVCTANSLSGIPAPLLDRLEIVRLAGYTEAEKLAIARRYLVPKQMEANGLKPSNIRVSKEAVTRVVREYTREAGVRNLERELASVCRKVARKVVTNGPETRVRVDSAAVERLLGVPRYRFGRIGANDEFGFVNGLAWTSAGGVMVPIEAMVVPGSGKTTMTGQLGSVFRESCEAAITYMRSRSEPLGLERDFWNRLDVHVHVPDLWGVDGPSAGITLATAVVSAVCRLPVRRDIAMTGEITLRGNVRPIGGLKEKLLAAVQAGVRRVLIPKDNEKDLRDIPKMVKERLEILPVEHMDEVLKLALAVRGTDDIFKGLARARAAEQPGESAAVDPGPMPS